MRYSLDSSIDSLDDEEIYDLINSRKDLNRLGKKHVIFGGPPVWRITSDAVAKRSISSTKHEPYIMEMVRQGTSIPIPQVRRVLPERNLEGEESCWWIVMDYIDGVDLEDVWPSMTWWRKLYYLWIVRSYVRQLQRVPLPYPDKPGPFDGSKVPIQGLGLIFHDTRPPVFPSYKDMADWFDYKRYCCQVWLHETWGRLDFECPKFDRSHPLVLCHMDIHLRNFLVEKSSGKLWLIDWGYAGAFPPWFEYASLAQWTRAAEGRLPWSWKILLPFIAGGHGTLYRNYVKVLVPTVEARPRLAYDKDYFDKLGISIG